MAAINKKSASLTALTASALSLPGLLLTSAAHAAEGDEVGFQYSHYQEGKRNISMTGVDPVNEAKVGGAKSFNPIEAESLHGSARVSLSDRVKFAFNYLQDIWGGATPFATTPYQATGNRGIKNSKKVLVGASPYAAAGAALNSHFVDKRFNSLFASDEINPFTNLPRYKKDRRLTHVMSTASPETRKQGDFKLTYEWDEMALSAGGGISVEDDYGSRFGNLGARFDFNQKQTTLNVDLSYTNSFTNAVLDHDAVPYQKYDLLPNNQYLKEDEGLLREIVQGTRQDWATHLGLTQVLNKDALVSADFSYTRSTGYLSNPYKGVAIAFADPNYNMLAYPEGVRPAQIDVYTEQRPEVRNQYGVGGRYVQHIAPLDAALHLDYRFSADDWGIQSHTFEADWAQPLGQGWTVTPRIRYYSQDAADFYVPFLITEQGSPKDATDANGNTLYAGSDGRDYIQSSNPDTGDLIYVDAQGRPAPATVTVESNPKQTPLDAKKLPPHYSSDHRLSGFGALSGGVTVTKQFAKGLTLETGFEYYTHQGGLKIGGGGEASYADFDYWLANAALKVNLDALSLRGGGHDGHDNHHNHHNHHDHGVHAPAGVMFDHMLPKAGDFMVGYRFMWNSQGGDMRQGENPVNDQTLANSACLGDPCYLTPRSMTMSMHMLDLMYAPTDWLTLMLMPQWMDMDMEMRPINGYDPNRLPDGNTSGHYQHHAQNGHETGGIGDLGMYALFKVFDKGTHHVHATAGVTAPTGDVDLQLRRTHQTDGGFYDYGMQLGSGTWDFKPSLTYTGHINDWSWGVQANGTVRMEKKNESGYRLGDIFQATAWGAYDINNWLTASVRGVYTMQGAVQGQFIGSAGGQFVDRNEITNETIPQTDESGNPVLDVNGKPVTINVQTSQAVYSSILKFGPHDYPQNYGGRFADIGFGLSVTVPSGDLAGNRFSVEWLQPVFTDMNGYQLDRDGALSATWSVNF